MPRYFIRAAATVDIDGDPPCCALVQKIKKNRDPRWNEEFQFIVEEPPVNDKLHVEVFSYSKRMGILHPKVLAFRESLLIDKNSSLR